MSDQNAIIVRDLGRVPYDEAFTLQKELQQEVIGWRTDHNATTRPFGYLLLLEHDPPVITVSRRKSARQHLVATSAMLEAVGVTVAETDRGGDITYHGPGQLVAYPILDLNRLGLRLHSYMRFLEDAVIDTLAAFGIAGMRDEDATGVWVNESRHRGNDASRHQAGRAGVSPAESSFASGSAGGPRTNTGDRCVPRHSHDTRRDPPPEVGAKGQSFKICAMGVRISRWVSMHGLALNVATNLDHFHLIVPCGLAGRGVTSMERLLGEACPALDEVKATLRSSMESRMSVLGAESESHQAAQS